MSEYSINVNFTKGVIDSDLNRLVQNDYNTTKLKFKFDDEDNRVVFKMLYPDGETSYITDITDDELIFGPGILSQSGTYEVEISLYTEDGRLTSYATMEFYVRNELFDSDEPVSPDDRVPILDQLITDVNGLIHEVDNIDVSVSKEDDVATVMVTKKDGTSQSVEIYDGIEGPQGPQGVQGKPFTIDKTYSSIEDMQADLNNVEVGTYAMIASSVESEDNAKLYYRDTNDWMFISDFSGATGIQGEQGPQGPAGRDGRDGVTPIKGVDYFTPEDIAEIEGDIEEIIGDLQDLDTTDKTDIVSAINEVANNTTSNDTINIPIGNPNSFALNLTSQQETLVMALNSLLPDDVTSLNYNDYRYIYPTNEITFGNNRVNLIRLSKLRNMIAGADDYYYVTIFLDDFLSAAGTSGTYMSYSQQYHKPYYNLYCSFDIDGKIIGVYKQDDLYTKGNVNIYKGTTWYVSSNGKQALPVDNSVEFVPTEDFQPSTKKYVDDTTGSLSDLDTTDKTNLVSAINEIASSSGSIDTYAPYISNGSYSTYYLNLTSTQEILKNMINSALPEDKTLITSSINYFLPTKRVWFTEGPLVHHLEISNSTTYYRVVIYLEPTTLNQTAGTYLRYYKWFPYPSYTVYCSIGNDGDVTGVYSEQTLTSQGSVRINLGAQALIVNSNYSYDVLPINNTNSYTPTGDYNPATKKYVDDAVAGAAGGSDVPIYILNTTNQMTDNNGSFNLSNDEKADYSAIITDAYAKGYKHIAIMLCSTTSGKSYMFYSNSVITNTTSPTFYADATFNDRTNMDYIVRRSLSGFGTWNNDEFTVTGLLNCDVERRLIVHQLNSVAYMVSNDYQPAHKKYVDDSIAAAITTTLGGSY